MRFIADISTMFWRVWAAPDPSRQTGMPTAIPMTLPGIYNLCAKASRQTAASVWLVLYLTRCCDRFIRTASTSIRLISGNTRAYTATRVRRFLGLPCCKEPRQVMDEHSVCQSPLQPKLQTCSAQTSDGRTLGLPEPPSTETANLLDSLRMVSELKRTYPLQAIRSYVISGTRSAADVLSLIGLAELTGVRVAASDDGADPGLMPVPLI